MNLSPWFITPSALVSALGCKLLLNKQVIGYLLILIAALSAVFISPSPYLTLVPLALVTIPFLYTMKHVRKKI